ncbi:SURF1 family protein, partial [Mycolicibacterium gadium]
MKRWTFLLRPGWIALALVVVAFAYLCFTVLAPWQLGKNTKTSRENNQIASSLNAEPVPVTTFLPHQDSSAPEDQWRRVTATGRYIPSAEVLARLRVVGGAPAFEVLVPFIVDGGPTVLVDRGYVLAVQGSKV